MSSLELPLAHGIPIFSASKSIGQVLPFSSPYAWSRDHDTRKAWLGAPFPLDLSTLPVKSEEVPFQYASLSTCNVVSAADWTGLDWTGLMDTTQSLDTLPLRQSFPWKSASELVRTSSRSSGERKRLPRHRATEIFHKTIPEVQLNRVDVRMDFFYSV